MSNQGWGTGPESPGGWGAPQPGGYGTPPPGANGPSQPPPYQTASNGKATASLVLGICGIVVCTGILSIPALLLGYSARKEIDAGNGAQSGRGNATAGIVLGWIGVAILVAIIVLIVVLAATGSLDEGSTTYTFDTESS